MEFATVLDATVATAAQGIGVQSAPPLALLSSLAADAEGKMETGKEESPLDLSALLPMIAAHFAAIGDASAAGKAADGAADKTTQLTARVAAGPQPLTAPPLHTSESAGTLEMDNFAATPVSTETGKTAILADKFSAAVESHAARHGGELQSTVAAVERTAAETTAPLAPLHRATSDAGPVLRIETPVAAARWGDELAQKVMWVANRNDARAELVLTPPHLGRVEVSVAVKHDGEASILFVSANQQVRDSIEQSLPRLREILADAGIALGHAGVHSDSESRDGAQFQSRAARDDAAPISSASPSPAIAASQRHGLGLVDTFA
jgi:flagellar hook-length control protein FliK